MKIKSKLLRGISIEGGGGGGGGGKHQGGRRLAAMHSVCLSWIPEKV